MAGLLHDIGKIIIAEFLASDHNNFLEKYGVGNKIDFPTIETTVLNTDHAEVGQMMAIKGELPKVIQASIRYHHMPSDAPEEHRALCILVRLEDILAMLGGYGTGCNSLAYRIDPLARKFLTLNRYDPDKLLLDIDREFSKARNILFETTGESNV